jgi:hypothetical protein
MTFPKIHIGRPQRVAALLLLVFLTECLWVVSRQRLTTDDYSYARCGREMWEKPSPLAGYFTTCGNLHGDGTFAYRAAALPLTVQRLVLLAGDTFRKPENRLYAQGALNGSNWESRHEIPLSRVKWLMHIPFCLFAVWLGGGLWWVSRRLFGNEGGFLALALYCFCPAVIRYAVFPNNEVLAMWGLYGTVYTAIGVAHAMQGPRHKWRPRIALLTLALGLAAAAHLLAGMLGALAMLIFMFYVADRRRSAVMQIVIYAGLGALAILFAFFSFRLAPFSYVFTGGGGRFWFSLDGWRMLTGDLGDWPILAGAAVSLILWVGMRRSRYFGNTAPLLVFLAIVFLTTTQVLSAPWLWALPFLLTFIGGVFADALETRQRKLFLGLTAALLVAQIAACLTLLSRIS